MQFLRCEERCICLVSQRGIVHCRISLVGSMVHCHVCAALAIDICCLSCLDLPPEDVQCCLAQMSDLANEPVLHVERGEAFSHTYLPPTCTSAHWASRLKSEVVQSS